MRYLIRCLILLPALTLSACGQDDTAPLVGTLARERLELINETSEPIVEIPVQEGAQVEKDQIILRLDARRTRAALRQAQARYEETAARLQELRNGPRSEQIEQARATLKESQSLERLAARDLARTQTLQKQQLASPEALDNARLRQVSAQARLSRAQAELRELEKGTRAESIEQAVQAMNQAAANRDALEITLQRLDIRAPQAGTLDTLPFHLGEQPPMGAVVAVLMTGPLYARVYIPEPLRARLHPGSEAQILLDGLDTPYRARLRMLSSDPSFTPYYSLTQHDRSRLAYLAKIDLLDTAPDTLTAGTPLQLQFNLPAQSP